MYRPARVLSPLPADARYPAAAFMRPPRTAAVLLVILIASAALIFAVHAAYSGPRRRTVGVATQATPGATARSATPHPTVTFDDGTQFELLSVREHHLRNGAWWGGDGSPVP